MLEPNKSDFSSIIKRYEAELKSTTADQFEATIRTIDNVVSCTQRGSLTENRIPQQIIEHWYTRLASALTHYFMQPRQQITEAELDQLTTRKQAIIYIYAASGYRSTKHLPTLIAEQKETGEELLSLPQAILLLSVIGIDDATDEMITLALRQDPKVLFHLMLGWLNQRAVLTEQGERNRTILLAAHEKIREIQITEQHFNKMVRCWMYCSYATYPQKHDIKETLNHLFVKRLYEVGLKVKPPVYRAKKRPRMLVIHERFVQKHAMFRCYAPYIRALKANFYLVALADKLQIDEASDSIFDEIITLDTKKQPFVDILRAATSVNPDIVYYPSVGMSLWSVLLANYRLATVQVAGQGHPASTRSEAIDYVITPKPENLSEQLYSEKLITFEAPACFDRHPQLPEKIGSDKKYNNGSIHVAVNCKVMKLTSGLLDICRKLQNQANQPLNFHFLPGEQGLYLDGIKAQILFALPGSTVYGYLDYPQFLEVIGKCHFALAPFPFGNTNSTVDCCWLQLPVVTNFGPELPTQYDREVLKAANYPKALFAKNDQEFFEISLKLINDVEFRKQMDTEILDSSSPEHLFLADSSSPTRFAKELISLYQSI